MLSGDRSSLAAFIYCIFIFRDWTAAPRRSLRHCLNGKNPQHFQYRDGKNCADYIAEELAKQPYFKEHPEQTGKYLLPEDSLGRSVPWGLVKGNGGSRKTIILTGHYDVVDTEEYGNERALAYDVEKWKNL